MTKRRRSFTPEFKREALRLIEESGQPLSKIARDLGIRPNQLREWRDQSQAAGPAPAPPLPAGSEAEEIRRLRRELEVVRQERDFLKKAAAFFAKESR